MTKIKPNSILVLMAVSSAWVQAQAAEAPAHVPGRADGFAIDTTKRWLPFSAAFQGSDRRTGDRPGFLATQCKADHPCHSHAGTAPS